MISLPIARSQARAAGRPGSWTQQTPRGAPANPPPYIAVQCPSTTICYALGSWQGGSLSAHPLLDTSTDGGVTWSHQLLDVDPFHWPDLQPLSCPAVNVCYLLTSTRGPRATSSIWITTDGGRTWTKHDMSAADDLEQISCPSANVCYALSFVGSRTAGQSIDNLLVTRDGGKTWNSRKLSVSYQPLQALTCPGVEDCYLVGLLPGATGPSQGLNSAVAATHDGGQSWHLGPNGQYAALACPTTQRCYAAGDSGLVTTDDGGKSWTNRMMPVANTGGSGSPLGCPNTSTCYVQDAGVLWRTLDAGTTWQQESMDPWGYMGVACPTVSVCYAVGVSAKVVKTTDGRTWSEATPFTRNWLYALACSGSRSCYAVGYQGTVLTTANGGTTWVRRASGTKLSLQTLACPASLICFAGSTGYEYGKTTYPLLKTVDGGRTWVAEDRSANPVVVGSLACPSTSVCFASAAKAVNSNPSTPMVPVLLSTRDGGRSWADEPLPRPLTDIACPTTRQCVGVGGVPPCVGDFVNGHAAARVAAALSSRPAGPCTVRGWLYTTLDGGLHWRREWAGLGRDLLSVACATPTHCYAGGFWIWGRSTGAGQTWAFHTVRTFPAPPDTGAPPNQPADFIRSLSCPSVSTCWALAGHLNDWNGLPVRTTDGGRSWHLVAQNVPVLDSSAGTGGLAALACPRVDRCYAAGGAGLVMAYAP